MTRLLAHLAHLGHALAVYGLALHGFNPTPPTTDPEE